ncbi:riboflavin synthase [Alsobacter soli]|uniref:Riboflavin synthase n=1 Tax=Alsobacter soli TaxID=2109933 RepID=A0A2T1HXL6_9HYPH|nr:riboflavin synthase [Alsobacter soli]PSC06432.1 riboflavin synthase [Alsobacter soli]
MFTGIVTDVGELVAVEDHQGSLRRLRVHCSYLAESIEMGASIATGGPCLTVTGFGPRPEGGSWYTVDAAAETLARTTVGAWQVGRKLNLERSLKIGDELGGHLVSGHVDGVAEVVARDDVTSEDGGAWGPTARFTIRAPKGLAKFIAEKGSVAIDGVSLTVNSVERDLFTVFLIPHTLEVTTLGALKAGDNVNLEVDQMARYAARLAEAREGGY